MRVPSGNIRTPRQSSHEERAKLAAADAIYVCRWIVQAAGFQTNTFPKNIVELAKRAIQ